ncbi:hypothetical protein I9W82_005322 [Candida metapsilosis]|uniref:Protein DSF2 n=1 Tax=Candida metapsilosis TaxID=273372 RepID=A0A8H7ZD06_9ASCO|nr:hypothetical protein I9W82_005322 [Candida metapsilosis]
MDEHLNFSKSDRDSVYSFDSVSTNERLLDRLDFDNESVVSADSRRSSTISSRGLQDARNSPYINRVPLTETLQQQSRQIHNEPPSNGLFLPQQPMNSLNAIRRMKDYAKPTDLTRGNLQAPETGRQQNNYTSRSDANDLPGNGTVFHKSNTVQHQTPNISSQFRERESPYTNHVQKGATNFLQPQVSRQASINTSFGSISNSTLHIPESDPWKSDPKINGTANSSVATLNPRSISTSSKSHSTHTLMTPDNSMETTNSEISKLSLNSSPVIEPSHSNTPSERNEHKRHLLFDNDIAPSSYGKSQQDRDMDTGTALETGSREQFHANNFVAKDIYREPTREQVLKSHELLPESRTVIAQELRTQGNHREASYQLQIAANEPFNNPKAMYLYALALKHGQGVKQNYNSSLKWLCKCILTAVVSEKNDQNESGNNSRGSIVASKLNKLSQRDLIQLVLANIEKSRDPSGLGNGENPESLYNHFKSFSKSEVNRIIARNKSKSDVVALSYFELGMYLLRGIGGDSNPKTDESNGITCLSKSAAMCCVEAMEQLGEVWATKTKCHKKDLNRAAAWLRSAEIFGAKSIGNSWIYKEKYLKS